MTTKEKVNAVAAVVCIAAISLIASAIYRRRRRQRAAGRRSCSPVEGKPQHRFKRVLADNSYSPFKHLKRENIEQETSSKVHPYEEEITVLLEQPPTSTNFVTSCECLDMDGSYAWVDTKQQLESLVQLLSKEQVFAVDTEQHSLRSFLGFTALMQISTQKEDFLIDTIALHDVMAILRPIFADPSICKVFHGSGNDVLWLQRDFHIYIVNMFDTAKACQVLSKPYKSLAYLLETYCRVSTDKTLQLEDWRLRPLSAEMIHYARTDAHYLLYIADRLASELRKETLDHSASLDDKFSFLSEASRLSNMVCLQLYVKEIESSPGASAAASIYSRKSDLQEVISFRNSETEVVIWKLCAWRDIMARIHDESVRFVLSDNAIVALTAKFPKNPSEVHDAIVQADLTNASLSTNPSLPSHLAVVSSHLNELCHLLHEVNGNLDDFFVRSLQKHLQPTGCCPLSIYNYALLSGFSLKQTGYLFSKKQSGGKPTTVGRKSSRELFVQKFSCKSPVYHNCKIYASDGRLLCYCDRRKLDWYLRRDLAKLVEKDPPGIMLLFEPKGRPEDEDNDFYIQSKKNICVGCGEKDHYLRYRIIPSCYRVHFPEHLKSHRSHDIVLLCVDCHEVAHTAAEKYKRQIAKEFGIPLFVQKILDSGESEAVTVTSESVDGVEETGVSPLQLRSAAMALLRHGSDMPLKRHDELMQIVRTYFGGRETSREDLEVALLVGMSPHEKRRLQKKRGLTFKYLKASVDRRIATSTIVEKTEDEKKLDNAKPQEASKDEIVNGVGVKATNTSTNGLYLDLLPEGDTSILSEDQYFDVRETYERTSVCNGHGNQDIVENAIGSCRVSRSHQVSTKTNTKISLLGHGLHGKQVVEHLLHTCEEDGIHQFCQRWRQVFVEATHPRYLPSGWDIMHSGRREFGEYSVYNPAKKAVSNEQHI